MAGEVQDVSLKTKIDLLNAEAWQQRVSNSTNALSLSKSAVSLAESSNYTKGLADGLRTLGFCYIRVSEHQLALTCLERSLALYESLDDLRGQSDVHEYYGIIQRSFGNYENSLNHIFKSLELRQETNYLEGETLSFYHLGVTYKYLGDLEQALDYFLKSFALGNKINDWVSRSYCLNNIGLIYFENEDYTNAREYFNQSLVLRQNAGDKWGEAGCLDNIGQCCFKTSDIDAAVEYFEKGLTIVQGVHDSKGEANLLVHLGHIYKHKNAYDKARDYYTQSFSIRKKIGDKKGEAEALVFLAGLYISNNSDNDAINEASSLLEEALTIGNDIKANDLLAKIHHALYQLNKQQKLFDEALAHLETFYQIEKDIHKADLTQRILNLEISHRVEKTRQEAEIYRLRNVELANLYEEIKDQKNNLEIAMAELKATQVQLIQSEKMASLGELTAGIAHEIQNPLNFVNNFSEVNVELIEELKAERSKLKGERNEQLEDEILNDIIDNEQKIIHHGQRADAIVKSMLQHSRKSTGQKEPADINALCDEYLRLSYHGLRAKDKTFNATLQTSFDENVGQISLVCQDIGRVFLNLFNNAFYAVTEKARKTNDGYIPTVSVSTKKINDKVEIRIRDNGYGIPKKVMDKIYQPFFTTKPTGQGTGLGLSLSYDIITKEHEGTITAETKEGEFTEFIILLPA